MQVVEEVLCAVQVGERRGYGEEEGKLDFGGGEEGAQHSQAAHFLAISVDARVHRGSGMPLPWTEDCSGLWSMRNGVKSAKGPEAVSSSEALFWV